MKPGGRLSLTPESFGGVPAERGTLRAPVCHAEPDGAVLELRFVRLGGVPDGVPLVFLTGGPGLSGIRAGAGRLFPMFDALRAHGDVILLDQRACVAGEWVTTGPVPPRFRRELHTRDDYLREIDRTIRHAAGALAKAGIPAHALNTNESADDVSMLVRALYGDDAVASLLGWSYGSHLAMAIIKRHEGMVARAVLAAPEGPNHTLKRPRLIQDHLERLSRRASMDLAGMLARVLDRVENEETWTVLFPDDPGFDPLMAMSRLSRFDMQWIISEVLSDTRALPKMSAWLSRMEAGDFMLIGKERALRGAWAALHNELPFSVARYCMDCASGATAQRRALIEREARETLLGNAIDFPLPDVCDALGCPDLGDEFREPPRSRVPVLFITGTVDCRTPAENVAELAPGFPNHEHLIVEDAGHGDLLLATGVQNAIGRFVRGEPLAQQHTQADAPLVFEGP